MTGRSGARALENLAMLDKPWTMLAAGQHTLGIITLEDVLDSLIGDVREAKLGNATTPGPHP